MDESRIRQIIRNVLSDYNMEKNQSKASDNTIPIEVSARHVHLSRKHVDALFGRGYELKPKRELSQPGQYVCEERVKIVTAKAEIASIAILGPVRQNTQVEISMTDARLLGLNPPIRQSGDLAGSEDVYIISEKNMVKAEQSVIIAKNHIHMSKADADRFGVSNDQSVRVRIESDRPISFEDVIVRVNDNFILSMHIDFDEANACSFKNGLRGRIIK